MTYGTNIQGSITYFNMGTIGYTPAEISEHISLSTDYSFENIELERKFREVAIDFLHNGKAKLYRSS